MLSGGAAILSTNEPHLDLLRTGDGYDVRALSEEPRKRDLARARAVVLRTDGGEAVYDLEDVREIGLVVSVLVVSRTSI